MAFSEIAKIVPAGAAANDRIGWGIALDGDYLAIGAPTDDTVGGDAGAVYVYVKVAGVWTFQQKLTASDGGTDPGEQFGVSVDLDGTSLIVGAEANHAGGNNRGAAYVFTRSGSVWTEQQKLVPSDPADNDFFGRSVTISGDYAVVSTPFKSANAGAAYVFLRTAGVWAQQQKLTGVANGNFGWVVELEGDVLVVGSPGGGEPGASGGYGAGYIFRRTGAVWNQEQRMGGNVFQLGVGIAISGTTVAVSAGAADAVYVWIYGGISWSFQQKIISGLNFNLAVSLSGDRLAAIKAGAPRYANIYERTGAVWSFAQQITASDDDGSYEFGTHDGVELRGSDLVVGAEAAGPGIPPGAAYYFSEVVPDVDPPTLQNRDPSPSETGVDPNANVYLEVVDVGSGVDEITVEIYLRGALIWAAGGEQGGASIVETPIAGGYSYDIDPIVPFASLEVVEVRVVADDTVPNTLDETYSFTVADVEGPLVEPLEPTDGSVGVIPSNPIRVRVTDALLALPIQVRVYRGNGFETAVTYDTGGAVFEPGFDGPRSGVVAVGDGFEFTIELTDDLPAGDVVFVRVYARDSAGNGPRL